MARRWTLLVTAAVTLALALASAAQAAVLSGQVTAQDGTETPAALADATVYAYRQSDGAFAGRQQTDPLGGYSVLLPDDLYSIAIVADGRETVTFRSIDVTRAARLDATLVPTGYARLHGMLREHDGTPIADADVSLSRPRPRSGAWMRTAADGSFSLAVPRDVYSFDFVDQIVDQWSFQGELDLTADRELQLTLPARAALTVRLLDDADAPVPDKYVQLLANGRPQTIDGVTGRLNYQAWGTTDAAGEVVTHPFDGPQSPSAHLFVNPPLPAGYAYTEVPLPDLRGDTVLDVHLAHAAQLQLTLLDGAGDPIDEASPFVDDRWGQWFGSSPYWLEGPEGRRTLTITGSDEISWWRYASGPFGFFGRRQETLTLPFGQRQVRVVDGAGVPVEGAIVTAPLQTGAVGAGELAGELTLNGRELTTGRDGEVAVRSFAGAVADPDRLGTVTPPEGSGLPARTFALADSGVTTVVLSDGPRTVHVGGIVRDVDGRAVDVGAMLIDDQPVLLDAQGGFEADLPPGQHTLYLRGSSFWLDGGFTALADRSLAITLPRRVTLTVRALGSGGRGVADAFVQTPATTVGGSFGDLDAATVTEVAGGAVTDADGSATLGFFDGAVAIGQGSIAPPSGSAYETTPFDLPPLDRDASVDVELAGGVDTAAPQIALPVTPDPLVRGSDWWNVSRVAVQVTASDPAGVASLACSVDGVARTLAQTRTATSIAGTFYVNQEGRHTAACTAVDGLGNAGSSQRAVNLDLKNPAAPTARADRPADDVVYGWWRDSVTVSFADNGDPLLADGSAGSGVDPDSVPASVTYDRSGTFTASGTVSDRAGRVSAAGRATVKVDADAPTSTLSCPAEPVRLGASATARWADADGQSGLPNGGSGTVALDTSSVGEFAAGHTAVDRVGHQTTSACRYRVVYAFAWRGNLQPAPTLNAIAPGVRTQTVWFSIGGNQGADPVASGWPRVAAADCATGTAPGPAAPATLAGPLVWDAVNGRYGIQWEVGADLPSGSCAAFSLQLADGVEREVVFAR